MAVSNASTASTASNGPRRLPLTRQRILAAAIRLADGRGLAALSMRKLGQALGVEAMSLYKHVPNKAALLDGMVGVLLQEIPLPPASGEWEAQVRAIAHSYRALAHAHPHLCTLVVGRALRVPEAAPVVEVTLAALRRAGFGALAAVQAFYTLTSYVEGYAISELWYFMPSGAVAPRPKASPGYLLQGLIADEAQVPHLTESLPIFVAHDRTQAFEFGLDTVLAGLRSTLQTATEATQPDMLPPRT
jgi:AcrR family transcriptional regulator